MLTSPRYHDRSLAADEALRSAFEFRNDVAPYIVYDANYWLFGELAGGSYGTGNRDPQTVGRAIERAIRKSNQ